MRKDSKRQARQGGFLLIEGLIAILIFAFGILGMVAMNAKAVSAQSDAQYRTEAANLADQISATIALSVDHAKSEAEVAADLLLFQQGGSTSSSKGEVTDWLSKVTAPGSGLPGATTSMQTIAVNGNLVRVTVGWKAPADTVVRYHTLVSYVSGV